MRLTSVAAFSVSVMDIGKLLIKKRDRFELVVRTP